MESKQLRKVKCASHSGLALPVCALLVLSGSGCKGLKFQAGAKGMAVNSPITVADGSMEVRTKASASFDPSANTYTITGGLACTINIGGNTPQPLKKGDNWSIISHGDQKTKITTNDGQTIVAQGSSASALLDGPGYSFPVAFSPPTLVLNNNPVKLTCNDVWPRCKVQIDYWVPAAEAPCYK